MSELTDKISKLASHSFSEHVLDARYEEGLLRHYRCRKPGTGIYGFDVTFVPGWVYLSGDIGHLALSRETDMLPWLRSVLGADREIDFRYVAEKSPHCITTREWSKAAALELIGTICRDEKIDSKTSAELRAFYGRDGWEHAVIPLLNDVVPHHYEYGDACDWSPGFLWCVFGLRWFVQAVDEHEAKLNGIAADAQAAGETL